MTTAIEQAVPPMPEEQDAPPRDQQAAYLETLFNNGDLVCIVESFNQDDEGKWRPNIRGRVCTVEEALSREIRGDPQGGGFVRVNPVRPGSAGSKDQDVIEYRNALVECDELPIVDQWRILFESRVPIRAMVHSGNRSLHSIISVDAGADRALYDERVRFVYETLPMLGFKPDNANKNPSRLTRIPGVARGDGRQWLVGRDLGYDTFEEWENYVKSLGIAPKPKAKPVAQSTLGNGHASPEYIVGALKLAANNVHCATQGERNETVHKEAFSLATLIHAGMSEDVITGTLVAAAHGCGLSEREARTAIAGGIKAGREHPREVPEEHERRSRRHKTETPEAEAAEDIDVSERLSELASARRLKAKHGEDLRHTKGIGWLGWDGIRWSPNEKVAHRLTHALGAMVRQEALTVRDPQIAKAYFAHGKRLESDGGIRSVLSVAKSLEGIDGDGIEWDSDPILLTVPNGTINLLTGEMRPHRRGDFITRLCPTPYDPKAKAPRFERMLDEVFEGDAELIDYVGWSLGYMLTGLVIHDSFYIFWGSGSNGKSTIISTLQRVFGPDIAQQVDVEDLLQQKHGRHSTGIAQLRGARMVIAQESGESRRLNEPLLKALSGGDKVRARLICQDGYEFFPSLKLVICTNSLPVIRDTSYGLWRRVRLVPFTRTFGPQDQDRNLRHTLMSEAEGILAWAVRHATRAYEEPPLPAQVRAATATYQAQEDTLGVFLNECCTTGQYESVENTKLYHEYQQWSGGKCESHRAFTMHLRARGFDEYRAHGGIRCWQGISLADKDLSHE